jgi:crotonobetaine/carnitine-CoA ligase
VDRALLNSLASGRSVSWLLEARAAEMPNKPFIIWEPFDEAPQVWTYGAFVSAVARVAGGLAASGVRKGSFVLIHLDNCPEYLLALFACARLGAVAVCTNTRSSLDELQYYAEHSAARWAVTQSSYFPLLAAAMPRAEKVFVTAEGVSSDPGGVPFHSLLDAAPAAPAAVSERDPAVILYTSGTTGRPKGAIWTHGNILWGGKVSAAHEGLTADDVQLAFLPLFHVNAQSYAIGATLFAGATCVLQPRFSVSRFWEVSLRNRCTFASQVYFTLRALTTVEAPKRHFYRLWCTGICDHPIASSFGIPTVGWWGMTETISHPIVGDHEVPNLPQTIGRAAVEYLITILNDEGAVVAPGETGHLMVRGIPGLSLFGGYLHDEEATAQAFDEQGWFISGDRVTLREDGSIVFADRSKDMLRIGSENVAASEIERVIAAVPGVVEVAVVAAPDPMLDEVPVAFILTDRREPGIEDEVVSACTQKLASFKVPRAVHILPDMPRANLGKVAKHKLREMLKNGSGQGKIIPAAAQEEGEFPC